ncbi:DUF2505 domain-containing protein [Pseudonocardia sp.]|uniref:DUF2505 domain-containing protein n=1 Tax=Pseudonocardia sp. TaxID=60912 RepID=UPI003D121DD4
MARSLAYRAASEYPAQDVYTVMVDADFLSARLRQMGGPGAALLEHKADADGARYALRHGLDAKDLPSFVAGFLPSTIVIERTETLRRERPGRYAGTVEVTIAGTPASASGGMRLADVAGGGSAFDVRADVTVSVPFVGGKIEGIVAEQVRQLLAAETRFTMDWIAAHR